MVCSTNQVPNYDQSWYGSTNFPRFPLVTCFPVPAFDVGYILSRARRQLHDFPRFPSVTSTYLTWFPAPSTNLLLLFRFPALATSYLLSLARHLLHDFPRFLLVTCYSRSFHWLRFSSCSDVLIELRCSDLLFNYLVSSFTVVVRASITVPSLLISLQRYMPAFYNSSRAMLFSDSFFFYFVSF